MRQIIVSGTRNNLNDTATEYMSLRMEQAPFWNSTESNRQELVPDSAKIIGFFVKLSGSPGLGASYKFTVRKNSADTNATVTISGSDTQSQILDLSDSISATDKLALECIPSSTPNVVFANWTVVYETEGDGKVLIINGQTDTLDTSATNNNWLAGGGNWQTTPGLNSIFTSQVFPVSGTLKNLYIELDGSAGPTGSDGWIFDVEGISVNVFGSSTTGNNTSDTASISAGDKIHIDATPRSNANARNVKWGIVFECDVEKYPFMGGSINTLNDTATEYNYLGGANLNWNSTEANRRQMTSCATISDLYVELGENPGSGKSYEFTLMKNGNATDLQVTISDAAKTGNDTSIVECDDFDELSIRCVPSGTPTVTDCAWSVAIKSIFPFPNSLMMVGHGR